MQSDPAAVPEEVASDRPASDEDSLTWARLVLFYVRLPRRTEDPPNVQFRAEVIYGEGEVLEGQGKQELRSENLGDGIFALHLTATLSEISSRLLSETFLYRLSAGQVAVFQFGFHRRPPVLGRPAKDGVVASPIHGVRRIQTFVRVDKLGLLTRISEGLRGDGRPRDPTTRVIAALARLIDCDLRGEYVSWLGDVLIAERMIPVAWWQAAKTDVADSCKEIDVHVRSDLVRGVTVEVRVLGSDDMCLCDRLLVWAPGDSASRRISLLEEVGSVLIRAWVDGELRTEELTALWRQTDFRLNFTSSAVTLHDRLSMKLRGATRDKAKIEAVETVSPTALTTAARVQMRDEPWSDLRGTADALVSLIAPAAPGYAYFPANPEMRAQAILQFATLMANASEAILVDPFFDSVGAAALLPRIGGEPKITVVTNLPVEDHETQLTSLQQFIQSAAMLGLPRGLRIVCAAKRDRQEQAFHDRWLLLKDNDRWRGFVLTNSFSGLAARFPLFVLETPLATTALLLEETEQLLDDTGLEFTEIWPPPKLPTSEPNERILRRGTFPYWRVTLEALVPKGAHSEAEWLRRAQLAGYIYVREDGLSWRMQSAARARALEWLMDSSMNGVRPRRSQLHRKRRGLVLLGRPTRPPEIGAAIIVLGELAAHGLEVSAKEVAEKLSASDHFAVAHALRRTFRDHADIFELRPGVPPEGLALRQMLQASTLGADVARNGMFLWNADHWHVGEMTWGRQFAYAVLIYANPALAIRLGQQLRDVAFLLPLVHSLGRYVDEWHEPFAVALLSASSGVLRAAGAQALALETFGQRRGHWIARPHDVPATLARLEACNLTKADRVHCLAAWGAHGDQKDGDGNGALGAALVRELHGQPDDLVDAVFEMLFKRETGSGPFLVAFLNLLANAENPAVELLEKAQLRFSQRFVYRVGRQLYFHSPLNEPLTVAIAVVTQRAAALRGRCPSDEIRACAPVEQLEREIEWATPVRRRPSADFADVAMGWVLLWDALASCSEDKGAVQMPAELHQRFDKYLGRRRSSLAKDVVVLLRRIVSAGRAQPAAMPPAASP